MKILQFILCAICAFSLSGCVGDLLQPKEDPTQFYLMRAVAKPAKIAKAEIRQDINLSPFALPAYLGRNQIVSLDGGAKMEISEFNRWGELPAMGFIRAFAQNIESVAPFSVRIYPEVSFNKSAPNLTLYIADFIGEIDGELKLCGAYRMASAKLDKKLEQHFCIVEKSGKDYTSYVSAMNRAIAKLSEMVANSAKEFNK